MAVINPTAEVAARGESPRSIVRFTVAVTAALLVGAVVGNAINPNDTVAQQSAALHTTGISGALPEYAVAGWERPSLAMAETADALLIARAALGVPEYAVPGWERPGLAMAETADALLIARAALDVSGRLTQGQAADAARLTGMAAAFANGDGDSSPQSGQPSEPLYPKPNIR